MEVAKSGRKKMNRNVRAQDLVRPKMNQQTSIEENEKIVEEMQQQILQLEKELKEKTVLHKQYISKLEYRMHYKWRLMENDQPVVDFGSKIELDKRTFADNAYRDTKAGKREINTHNLNYQMIHKTHCMSGERRLLKMLNPNKDIDSGFSIEQLEEQMWKLHCSMNCWPYPIDKNTIDGEICKRELKEVEYKRNQVLANALSNATLWNLLPSTKDLRSQIQAMEVKDEEKRKEFLVRRKKIESWQRKIKKTDNEIKSMRKMIKIISNRMQKALEFISHQNSCLEKITTL